MKRGIDKLNNKFHKTFSTGEFADLFDINKDTLLYYDKINLFKPAGIHSNGYRYYTLEQLDSFIAIHSLRSVNLPIKDLKKYFASPSIDSLNELASIQIEKIKNEISNLKEIQTLLSNITEVTNELSNVTIGELIIKEMPVEYVLYSSAKDVDWDAPVEELSNMYEEFIKEIGIKELASFGSVLKTNKLLNEEYQKVECLFCRMEGPNAVKKPAGMYAIIYHQGKYDSLKGTYFDLIKELKKQDFITDGDVYEEYLLHSLVATNEDDYITKISVKVKKTQN